MLGGLTASEQLIVSNFGYWKCYPRLFDTFWVCFFFDHPSWQSLNFTVNFTLMCQHVFCLFTPFWPTYFFTNNAFWDLHTKTTWSPFLSFTAWKVSVFGVFLVRIFPHSDWLRRDISLYSVRMRENTDQKNSEYRFFSRSVSPAIFYQFDENIGWSQNFQCVLLTFSNVIILVILQTPHIFYVETVVSTSFRCGMHVVCLLVRCVFNKGGWFGNSFQGKFQKLQDKFQENYRNQSIDFNNSENPGLV